MMDSEETKASQRVPHPLVALPHLAPLSSLSTSLCVYAHCFLRTLKISVTLISLIHKLLRKWHYVLLNSAIPQCPAKFLVCSRKLGVMKRVILIRSWIWTYLSTGSQASHWISEDPVSSFIKVCTCVQSKYKNQTLFRGYKLLAQSLTHTRS